MKVKVEHGGRKVLRRTQHVREVEMEVDAGRTREVGEYSKVCCHRVFVGRALRL